MDNVTCMFLTIEKLETIIRDTIRKELNLKKEKELLDTKELSLWLGISLSTLNVWKRENRIPYKKMGRRIFFSKKEVFEALKESGYNRLKELGA